MSTITTYSTGYGAAVEAQAKPKRASFLQRFLDRLVESRMRRAEEFLRHHHHLMPRELEDAGWKLTERTEDSLPFVR